MASKPTKREWTVLLRKKAKTAARKFNAPTRGIKQTLQQENAKLLASIEARLKAGAAN